MEGMERWKKEAKHFRLAGGSCNKQENLLTGLVLDGHKTSRSPHPPTRILKVYIEPLTGSLTYIVQMVSTARYYLKAVLGAASRRGKASRMYVPRIGERVEEPLIAQVRLMGQPTVSSSQ